MKHLKQLFTLLTVSALLFAVIITAVGCNKAEDGETKEVTLNDGPIEGWEDIFIPEGAEKIRSAFSGPVENHDFELPEWTRSDFFALLENEMPLRGWTMNNSSKTARNFVREGDVVNYSSNEEGEDGLLKFLVIIEPAGTYNDDEASDTEESETTDAAETATDPAGAEPVTVELTL